jgi:hypothetical protein
MPSVQNIVDTIVKTFQSDIAAFRGTYATVIDELEAAVSASDNDLSDFFWDQIAELKGHLGMEAANTCADNGADEAIDGIEAWVTDNISNTEKYDIPVTLWMHGIEHGAALIQQKLPN